MLNKSKIPTAAEISEYIGKNSVRFINELDLILNDKYHLTKDLRFPFGNNYGWGYKYSHKNTHLFYLFFEKNQVCILIQIGSGAKGDLLFSTLSDYAKDLWKNRYPCGDNGGWINYRIDNTDQIYEVLKIITLKKPFINHKQ